MLHLRAAVAFVSADLRDSRFDAKIRRDVLCVRVPSHRFSSGKIERHRAYATPLFRSGNVGHNIGVPSIDVFCESWRVETSTADGSRHSLV